MTEKKTIPVPSLPVIYVSFEASNGDANLEKIAKPKIDPIRFPPLRDVYQPKKSEETVRFSPLTGEVFVFGKHGKNGLSYVDKLTPSPGEAHEQVWFEFRDISDAYGFCKDLYLRHGLSNIVNYTEDLVQRVMPFLPQISSKPLNEKSVKELFINAFSQLIMQRDQLPSLAEAQDITSALDSLIHNWRGIRRHRYSDFLTRSHLGWEFLEHFFRILNDQNKGEDFSPMLATILVEQYIEGGMVSSIKNIIKRAMVSNTSQSSMQKAHRSLKEMMESVDFSFFKAAPYRKQIAFLIAELKGFGKEKEGFFKELLGESVYEEVMEDWRVNGGVNNNPMAILPFMEHYLILPELSFVKQGMVRVLNKIESILIN